MAEPEFLHDSYLEWVKGEGLPVVDGFAVNLLQVEARPWAHRGARGAFVHLTARGDYLSAYVCEIPPGGATEQQTHLSEDVFYVRAGRGSTTVETAAGQRQSFEWSTASVFAVPLNAPFRLFNGSGTFN